MSASGSQKTKQYNQVFLNSYSKQFPCIGISRKGPNFAFCAVCACDVKIAHGGLSDIKNHINSKKHADYTKSVEKTSKIGNFFNSGENDSEVINAECLFTCFILEHNLPLAVADHAGPLFRKMFPKCDAAKKYGSGRTKTTAIIERMAIEKKKSLECMLKNTVYAVSIDGSNDTDSQLYPIVVTYFDVHEGQIENSLLSVPVLSGNSTGENIGNLLLDTLQSRDIEIKNCIALSVDNANVMVGPKKGVAAVIKRKNEELLVMGCLCHRIHIAAEKGANTLPVAVDEILIDVYYYLQKSSKRKEELKELQLLFNTEGHKILKHVCTRWLSLGRSLKRILEQWDPLTSFFKNEVNKTKYNDTNSHLGAYQIPLKDTDSFSRKRTCGGDNKQPPKKFKVSVTSTPEKKLSILNKNVASKNPKKFKVSVTSKPEKKLSILNKNVTSKNRLSSSDNTAPNKLLTRVQRLFLFFSSEYNKAFCTFLDFIIPTFEKTNVILQSQEPKIHVLNSLLLDLFKELISKFVSPDAIKKLTDKKCSLLKVEYADKSKQKIDEDLLIGSATLNIVKVLKDDEKVTFYSSVRKYYVNCCHYIRQNFNLNSDLFEHAEVSNLDKISSKSFTDVDFFLDKFPIMLPQSDNESRDEARDRLQAEFSCLQIDELTTEVAEEKRMDRKWAILSKHKSGDGTLKYNRLSKVMLSILTIPHSNAECERIFSTVKKTRTQFRNLLSNEKLEDILVTKSIQKGFCFEQNFDKEFLKKAKSATYNSLNSKKKIELNI